MSREQRVKGRPSITLNFDPDADADGSLRIVALAGDSPHAFNIQLRAGVTGTNGFSVTGVGLLNDTAGLTADSVTSNVSVGDRDCARWRPRLGFHRRS